MHIVRTNRQRNSPPPQASQECPACRWFAAECERTTRLDQEASDRLAENSEAADGHSALLRNLVHRARMDCLVARLELQKHRNLHRRGTDSRLNATPRPTSSPQNRGSGAGSKRLGAFFHQRFKHAAAFTADCCVILAT
jgi:hypothetical protein